MCRGCKRFAHEIVKWNGFDADQQAAIWGRLNELRDGAVAQSLRVCDAALLAARAELNDIPHRDAISTFNLAYEVLRTAELPVSELSELGLEPVAQSNPGRSTRDLVREIDREFYARSLAQYERNFKISAQ